MVVRGNRSAFTLFEILLVLAIIVIAAAIALPSLESMSCYHTMTGCVDTVRGAWLTARAQAIEDSRPYRFSVSGTRYRIAPDSDEYWRGNDQVGNDQNPGSVFEGELPDGVRFAEKGQVSVAPTQKPRDEEKSGAANWVTRAIFLPDGTAIEDDMFEFRIPGTRPRTIRLRALTGTIEVKTQGEEDN